MIPYSLFDKKRLAASFFLLALTALFYVGFLKNRGALVEDYDASMWYVAGQCWLEGVSPYDHAVFLERYLKADFGKHEHGDAFAFAYPPTLSAIALPMVLFDWDLARQGFRTVSFLAFCSACAFLVLMLRDWPEGEQKPRIPWGYLGVSALLYPVSITLHQGQTSLVVLWGMVAALYGCHKGRPLWTVVGVVFACIKPQMSLPLLVYLCFRGGFRQVAVGILVSALLAIGVVIPTLTPNFIAKYAESIAIHRSRWENGWFFYDSLPSLLGQTAVGGLLALAGAGVACVAAFWLARGAAKTARGQSAVMVRHFQLICALTLATMPLHRYDAVLYVPIVATLSLLRTVWQRLLLLVLILFHGRVWSLLARLLGYRDSFAPATVAVSILGGVILGVLVVFYLWDSRNPRDASSADAL